MIEFPSEPFTLSDLDGLGITRARLRTALADREVRRVLRGVFVAGSVPDSVEMRVSAARRVVAPGQVICDRTAAWLHGVEILGYTERHVLPPVEVCALRWHARSRLDGVRGRTRDLLADDVTEIADVLVTTPMRTALDLGCNLRRRDALAALDQFRRLHGLTLDQLVEQSSRFRGRRGVVQLRGLLPLSDPRSESVRETWVRLAMLDAGLPLPVPQHWVELGGLATYRLDLAYPAHRIAIEYDGREFHDANEVQRARDRVRRDCLRDHGWTLIVVREGDFTGDRLDRWIGRVRDALRSRPDNLRW